MDSTFHRLPFAEDIRKFSFPPLDPNHGCRPAWQASAEQCAAMDDLFDALDLDRAGPNETEMFVPEETFNPTAQHLLDCVRVPSDTCTNHCGRSGGSCCGGVASSDS
jgi:hypothetical protein